MTDDRPVALITGATSGIGRVLADRLCTRYRLVLTGRRAEADVPGGLPAGALYVRADLRAPADAVAALADALDTHGIDRLDRAVVNAGTGFYGPAREETPAMIAETLSVNLTAPVLLARALAPHLEAASGRLTLIGSVAHKRARRAPSYAASKAGLNGFARALGEEWRGRIGVQIIHPGPVATGMHRKAGFDPGRLARLFLSPDDAAGAIARLIETGRSPARAALAVKLRSMAVRRRA